MKFTKALILATIAAHELANAVQLTQYGPGGGNAPANDGNDGGAVDNNAGGNIINGLEDLTPEDNSGADGNQQDPGN